MVHTEKRRILLASIVLGMILSGVFPLHAPAQQGAPPEASAGGKYASLVQVLPCPQDQASYGAFRDYGYWSGGTWCGQKGKAGYWVWVNPNWYVWAEKVAGAPTLPPAASAHGKYANLVQTLPCPQDAAKYGQFTDYGHWGGGAWCGQTGKAGYWVWANPNWYVWEKKIR